MKAGIPVIWSCVICAYMNSFKDPGIYILTGKLGYYFSENGFPS